MVFGKTKKKNYGNGGNVTLTTLKGPVQTCCRCPDIKTPFRLGARAQAQKWTLLRHPSALNQENLSDPAWTRNVHKQLGKGIHHIHNWPPCNFEKFKMTGTKERIEYREKLCPNEQLGLVLGSYSHLTRSYRLLNSG